MEWSVYRITCPPCGTYVIALEGKLLPSQCRRCRCELALEDWEHYGKVDAEDETVAVFLIEKRRRTKALVSIWSGALCPGKARK